MKSEVHDYYMETCKMCGIESISTDKITSCSYCYNTIEPSTEEKEVIASRCMFCGTLNILHKDAKDCFCCKKLVRRPR